MKPDACPECGGQIYERLNRACTRCGRQVLLPGEMKHREDEPAWYWHDNRWVPWWHGYDTPDFQYGASL